MVVNYHKLAERLVEVADDIDALVEYLWDDEQDDFAEQSRMGEEAAIESHIFRSIVKVSNALHDFGDTPEGCISPDPEEGP